IVEHQRALISRAAYGRVTTTEQPTGPGGREFLKVGAAGTGRGLAGFRIGQGRRQFLPTRSDFRGRIPQARLVHPRPDTLRQTGGDPVAGCEVLQCRRRLSQGRTMAIAPRDVEGLAVLVEAVGKASLAGYCPEALRRVNVFDAIDGRKLEAGLAR